MLLEFVQDLFLASDSKQEGILSNIYLFSTLTSFSDLQATRRLFLLVVSRIVERAVAPRVATNPRDEGLLGGMGAAARTYVPGTRMRQCHRILFSCLGILHLGSDLIPALFELFQEQDRLLIDFCHSLLIMYVLLSLCFINDVAARVVMLTCEPYSSPMTKPSR
jgi:hypothetical protein